MIPDEEKEQKEEECLDLVNKANEILIHAASAHNKTERKKLEKEAEDVLKQAEEIMEEIVDESE